MAGVSPGPPPSDPAVLTPSPLRALEIWNPSPSELQQSKLPVLTPPNPRVLFAGEGGGGGATGVCSALVVCPAPG